MQETAALHFQKKLYFFGKQYPLTAQLELTYRCNLNCVHCYCKGLEDFGEELTLLDWKRVIDELKEEGCVYLTFTGGEPLLRPDFPELYFHAKKQGFIISILTNGQELNRRMLSFFARLPPHLFEITLNGITAKTYEAITQKKGSFSRVMENIKRMKEKNLPLVLKANCLKQNKGELGKIKAFADTFLGRKRNGYFFKYDPMIYPRLNRDLTPLNFRLSFHELTEVIGSDRDIWQQYQKSLQACSPVLRRGSDFLYHCDSWMHSFFINPYGWLKFCNFSGRFSTDLKTGSFKRGFYGLFPRLLNERFKYKSKCRDCALRADCYYCPARAYLETGNEEAPVEYYCQLAKGKARLRRRAARDAK